MLLADAVKRRTSVRAYLDAPVDRQTVEAVFEAARWAPSGNNLQPWKAIAVAGAERDAVCGLAKRAMAAGRLDADDGYPVRPDPLPPPYADRRARLGTQMYALLGIARDDDAARRRWAEANLEFFGAPVGVFFVIDRIMGHGQWASLGMFMQSVVLAATSFGLGTCLQEAWAPLRRLLHGHFGLDGREVVYCGMALGWPDRCAPINRFRPDRAAVGDFARFVGFERGDDA